MQENKSGCFFLNTVYRASVAYSWCEWNALPGGENCV